MNNIKSLLEMHNHHQSQMASSSHFDPASSDEDFLEQMLSSVPNSSGTSFPWGGDDPPADVQGYLEEQSGMLTSKVLMLQQQLLMSRGIAASSGFIGDPNDVAGGSSNSTNTSNDASIKALFNRNFNGGGGQLTSNQPQHFHNHQGGILEAQNFGVPAGIAAPKSGGAVAGQPRQRVRARRGQATDPHSIAERLRRERIAERMKGLQELVPNANKTDKASMLDEIIDYVKFLQLQVKVLSISRLSGAAAVAPGVSEIPSEGKTHNGRQTTSSSSNNNDAAATVTEQQVAKLLEEDMGSAMQYLQGKGLCLMPISLATAISTATCHTKSLGTTNLNSSTMSVSTVHSAAMGGMNGGGEVS